MAPLPRCLANLKALVEVDDTLVVDQAEAWIQDVRRGKLVASQVAARSVLPTRRAVWPTWWVLIAGRKQRRASFERLHQRSEQGDGP